jgi:hypothetical protein
MKACLLSNNALVKLILDNPENVYSYNKENRNKFEMALNIQEIIFNILSNQEMMFTRDFLKQFFTIEKFFELIDKSISKLDELELQDNEYDEQDYEDLRDWTYIALINIYHQLYFNINYSHVEKESVAQKFNDIIGPIYKNKLNEFNNSTDFDDQETYKKSELKFLVKYMTKLMDSMKRYAEKLKDDQLNRTQQSQNMGENLVKTNQVLNEIQTILSNIFDRINE